MLSLSTFARVIIVFISVAAAQLSVQGGERPNFRSLTFKESCNEAFEALVVGDNQERLQLQRVAERLHKGDIVGREDIFAITEDSGYEQLSEFAQIHLRTLTVLDLYLSKRELNKPDSDAIALGVVGYYLSTQDASGAEFIGHALAKRLKESGKTEEADEVLKKSREWMRSLGVAEKVKADSPRYRLEDVALCEERIARVEATRFAKAQKVIKVRHSYEDCNEAASRIDDPAERLSALAKCGLLQTSQQVIEEKIGRRLTADEIKMVSEQFANGVAIQKICSSLPR